MAVGYRLLPRRDGESREGSSKQRIRPPVSERQINSISSATFVLTDTATPWKVAEGCLSRREPAAGGLPKVVPPQAVKRLGSAAPPRQSGLPVERPQVSRHHSCGVAT